MRRVMMAAVVVGVALGLVGCGGIPTSGSVQQGQLIDEEIAPDFGYDPSGPQEGATQADILTGFIQAATSPQDDYKIARQFLTPGVAEDWEPNEITQVRSGVGTTQANDDGSFTYVFSSSAYVDKLGTYVSAEQSTQRLEFGFVQNADGEWRISEAPDGIVLSSDGFGAIFDDYALYYYDPTYQFLVPDVRWFPRTTRLATRLVLALLSGQSSWLAQGITNSEFPTGTTLDSAVTIESGVATVDLSEEVLEASPEQRARMAEQLKNTIRDVSSVVMTVRGVPIDVPDSRAVPVINPSAQGQLLARTEDGFGFLTGGRELGTLSGQSAEVVELDALDVTLSRNRDFSAVLAADGVHAVFADNSPQLLLDGRASLVAPSTDPSGYVWSVPATDASAIRVFSTNGERVSLVTPIVAGAQVVSLAVSRDGSRLMMYTSVNAEPHLTVYGILREDGVPFALGPPFEVRLDQLLTPLDAAWVDDRTIATLAEQSSSTTGNAVVTLHQLGGPSESKGRVVNGRTIVGGSDEAGLRVVSSTGDVYGPRGSGWAATGATVLFLATQQ